MDGDQAPQEENRHLADNSLLFPIGITNMFLTCRRRLKVDCTELCLNIHIDALFIAFYYGYKQLNKNTIEG